MFGPRFRYVLAFILTLINCALAFTQADSSKVLLHYKYYGDSTVLRWGYDHPQLWYDMRNQKVAVYRRDVTNKGSYQLVGTVSAWDSTTIENVASKSSHIDMLLVVLENNHRNWHNTYYNGSSSLIEKHDNFYNRWSLVHLAADRSFIAANAAGMRFVDKDLVPNITYAYKIVAHGKTDYKVAFPVKRDIKPIIFEISEEESSVTIRWDKKLHDYHYTAYWIEQSENGRNFKKLNTTPIMQMMDEGLGNKHRFYTFHQACPNYKQYHYRILGIDAFGDESLPSESIMAMGKDRTGPKAAELFIDSLSEHLAAHLFWKIENTADVSEIHLEESFGDGKKVLKNWAKSNDSNKKETLQKEGIYKFRLITVDTAGNQTYSNTVYKKISDLIPPAKPQRPTTFIDSSGIITLTWTENAESDVIGYNIYAADSKNRNFIKLNSHTHRSRIYRDTVDKYLLTENRYYYLIAIDNDFMRSLPSDTIQVNRPDAVPPSPALIGDYHVSHGGIQLTILPSSSRDVVRHELFRKTKGEEWSMIQSFTTIPKSFIDHNITSGTLYYYKIEAVDEQGLRSKVVKEIALSAMQKKLVAPQLNHDITANTIAITIHDKNGHSRFLVYKSINGSKYQKVEEIRDTFYTEKLAQGISCKYRVRSTDDNGNESPFSNEVSINQ